ncbi:hypothetical protein ACXIZN_25465 [Amycolatopsis sp. TRM77291]
MRNSTRVVTMLAMAALGVTAPAVAASAAPASAGQEASTVKVQGLPPGFGCVTDVFHGQTWGQLSCTSGPGRAYALRIHCNAGYYVQGALQKYTRDTPPGVITRSDARCYKGGVIDDWTAIYLP